MVLSRDPEAIVVQSDEMETERTQWVWPQKVLITPPVCTSQSLRVLSLLPDTSDVPSGEKVRDLTQLVCPERTATWLPVIALRMMMFPDRNPTARVSFQCAKDCGVFINATVREHVPHPAGTPLTTLTSPESSAV